MLSIVIPTYNRAAKVCDRIAELLPQLASGVSVRIIDNASDEVVETVVRQRFGEGIGSKINFHRNAANVGLAANLCKCFEHADGEWLWVLGDDDSVLPDAVGHVLARIASADAAVGYMSFSTSLHTHNGERTIGGFRGLVEGPGIAGRLSNLLFISAGCYRVRKILPHLRAGYLMVYSHVPHVAMLATMMADLNVLAVMCPERLVERSPQAANQAWSHLKVLSGLPALIDLEGVDGSIAVVVRQIVHDARWRPFLGAGLHYIFNEESRPIRFWWLLLARIFICGNAEMKIRSALLMSVLPLASFKVTRQAVRTVINRRISADANEGLDRL
ncbi:glycosyltransferase family 2 protein [Luteolibacter ambystomatis]|uniref:Glycosyltransferase family 2 protein n=1 Tax=Luteolibacter ambystomatis TaxID=2824561 RepID=A0A975G6Z2_9BACT|nr:glycosyltransferase family 2 protein [Luteolibacter ambystomatis]QUE50229.1 glycosyltransferase family 2 protein [Luteolibacter ambystomatis]